MEDHHYVPQCYLRKFLPTGKPQLYYLSTGKQNFPRRVLRAAPKSVCFEKGLYQIETENVRKQTPDGDAFFIERRAFPYETKELIDLIATLEQGRSLIASVRAKRLVAILLDLKRRNIYFRNAFIDPHSIEEFKHQYSRELTEWMERTGETPEKQQFAKYQEERVHRELSDEAFKRDLYRSALIKNIDRPPGSVSQVLRQIEGYKLEISQTDSHYPLITSDNPGFCLMDDGSVYPVRFSLEMKVFCSPLTPTMMLSLRGPRELTTAFKTITRRNLPPHMVQNLNMAIMATSTGYVYSNSKSTLETLIPSAEEIAQKRET